MPAKDSEGLMVPNDATVVATKGGAATCFGLEQADTERTIAAAQSRRAMKFVERTPIEQGYCRRGTGTESWSQSES